MTLSVALYRKMEGLDPSLRDILLSMAEEVSNTPTKEDFTQLRGAVQELAEAQKRTEIKLEQLTEAQKRTEVRVEQLAEAQKRTEIKLEQLAEAQKRTEVRVEQLAEAQKHTEIKLEQLAEAQRRTEAELRMLGKAVKRIEVSFGGLSISLGYQLEDTMYPLLPKVLREDFGIEVEGDLERKFVTYQDGRDDEVNVFGKGRADGKEIFLIGEVKAQLGKPDAKRFAAMLKRLGDHLRAPVQPFMICYSIHPAVEEYIASEYPAIRVYRSHQIRRRNLNPER